MVEIPFFSLVLLFPIAFWLAWVGYSRWRRGDRPPPIEGGPHTTD